MQYSVCKGQLCCAAGLYLPTSDIDLVVMDSKSADVRTALYAVSRKLSERQIARDVQVGSSTARLLVIRHDPEASSA